MFIVFVPAEVEGELQRGSDANLIRFQVLDSFGRAQSVESFQQRLDVTRGTRAGHGRQLADFNALGRNHSILRKCLSQPAENVQAAERRVEPGTKLSDLLLKVVKFGYFWSDAGPFRLQARELPLLDEKQERNQ